MINITRTLGGAHVPPTKVFRRFTGSVNKTIVKPRVAAVANTYTSDLPDVNKLIIIIIIIIKTFITRKFAEAANARSVDSTEEKRLQSLFEDVQRDVR